MKINAALLEAHGHQRPYDTSRPLSIEEVELAPPGPTEVLVALEAAGICHSDLSVIDGTRPRPVPMVLGHEGAGRVVEVGAAVAEKVDGVRVGDRVVMTFLPRCGRCPGCATEGIRPCVPGSASNAEGTLLAGGRRLAWQPEAQLGLTPVHHHLGVSAFATYAVVDARSLVVVEDDIPPAVAALLGCAVLTGGGAVLNAGRPKPGERLAVVGLGGVGMSAVLTAAGLGDVSVTGIDPVAAKRDQARHLGAHAEAAPEAAEMGAFDVVIEAAGSARAFETAYRLLAPGGRLVTVGLPAPDATATIAPLDLVAGGRSIIGSYLGSAVPARDIPTFARRWREGRLRVEELISHELPLAEINLGMERLAAGQALRQIVRFP